jgi:hypothetical protein
MHGLTSVLVAFASALVGVTSAASQEPDPPHAPSTAPEVVIIPTLGNDHQFDLDYTVIHLMAVLDAISPDALVVADYTEWLDADCIWGATQPERHAALAFAREKSIPIRGTRMRPPTAAYDQSVAWARRYHEMYPNLEAFREDARTQLDRNTARIAREYTFNPQPQTLERLIETGFAARAAEWTSTQRDAIASAAQQTVDSLHQIITSYPQHRRWAVILQWQSALEVEELLRRSTTVRYRVVSQFLPVTDGAFENRTDAKHLAWVLSGVLDEWYSMWAPEVFPAERIARLLARLKELAPDDPTTKFIQARWLMRSRDWEGADSILAKLVEDVGDARFTFPLNGKWIRPPWTSVRDKSKLNLAFVYDVRGERARALVLYAELLELGDGLNSEARASGYIYDDIRHVIESYTRVPYTGSPEEAYRHFPETTGIPVCDPQPPAPGNQR